MDEAGDSWIGQSGAPAHLNEVALDAPQGPLGFEEVLKRRAGEGWEKVSSMRTNHTKPL